MIWISIYIFKIPVTLWHARWCCWTPISIDRFIITFLYCRPGSLSTFSKHTILLWLNVTNLLNFTTSFLAECRSEDDAEWVYWESRRPERWRELSAGRPAHSVPINKGGTDRIRDVRGFVFVNVVCQKVNVTYALPYIARYSIGVLEIVTWIFA